METKEQKIERLKRELEELEQTIKDIWVIDNNEERADVYLRKENVEQEIKELEENK